MSNEPRNRDAQTLLNTAQFPPMQIDSTRVLAGGRRRVRRRRTQVAGVAVAALLVIMPSSWLAAHTMDRSAPVPAGSTKPLTTGLFARTGNDGNLGNGRVRPALPSTNGIDTSVAGSTYQIGRSGDSLTVSRVDAGTTVDLHRTAAGPSGLFQSTDGKHGIVAVRIPADAVQANLYSPDGDGGAASPVASTLPDGTSVVLFETAKPFTHATDAVIWRRASGAIGASTGEQPAVLTQDGRTFYYFSRLGAFGINGRQASSLAHSRSLAFGEGIAGNQQKMDFVIAGLYPRGVADVRLSPAIHGAVVRVAHLPGTHWDLVTARYRSTAKTATPKVVSNYGSWNPSSGNPPPTAPAK